MRVGALASALPLLTGCASAPKGMAYDGAPPEGDAIRAAGALAASVPGAAADLLLVGGIGGPTLTARSACMAFPQIGRGETGCDLR